MTATRSSARRSATARSARGAGREAPLLAVGNDRWRGRFEPESCGLWEYGVLAWVDRIASWQRELARKVEAKQDRPERASSRRARSCSGWPSWTSAAAPRGARGRPLGARRVGAVRKRRRRPRAGAFRLLVRALPALLGRLRRRGEDPARPRRPRLRRPVPAADPSDRAGQPQGAQQRARLRRRAIPAARGRSAPTRAGTTRSIPTSAPSADFDAHGRARAASSGSTSRSTSRSSARPTTRG